MKFWYLPLLYVLGSIISYGHAYNTFGKACIKDNKSAECYMASADAMMAATFWPFWWSRILWK